MMSDQHRGQSETVGFLLIFSVVVLTISMVGVAGFAGLDTVKDFQRTTNVEQGILILGDNIDDIVQGTAPNRSTEIRLKEASLSHESAETTITITDENGISNSTTIETYPIVYNSGTNTTFTYRDGAIVRQDGDSAVMLRDPGYVLTAEEVILPLIVTSPRSTTKVGGQTAVNVRAGHRSTSLHASGKPVSNITLNVTSPHAETWKRYFGQFDGSGPVTAVSRNQNSVEVTIETERVYVSVHHIDVSFQ